MGDGRVHAREHAEAKFLCGARRDGKWTRKQRELTYLLCIDEVIRRRAAFVHYAQPREFTLCGTGGTLAPTKFSESRPLPRRA
jgi:hypothetical protein